MEDKKLFMTYEQQIALLQEEKNLIISDKDKAICLLKNNSYFNLISGYKVPFKNKTGRYKNHTKIEDIYSLYCFDNQLRHIFMKHILEVEIHIKSLLSYEFTEKYGESESEYLNPTNYDYKNPKIQKGIIDLIGILNGILKNCNDINYMKHQKDKYKNIPLWVLIKALTFGQISKMYSFQAPSIQTKISKEFPKINENDLENMLSLLAKFRNVCAHNERLFDYKYQKMAINDMELHKYFFEKENGIYKKGKNDLFAIIISLKYLLPDDNFKILVEELSETINNFFKETNQIQLNQLYKYMGFPNNWEEIGKVEIEKMVFKTITK